MISEPKKQTLKFTFTVEGHTEQWYFNWLKGEINNHPKAEFDVTIVSKIEKSPLKFAKTVSKITNPEIAHICDIESNNEEHKNNFENILNEISKVKKQKGLSYQLGYSNFTFELWMILHKIECNAPLTDRKQYLHFVNRAFNKEYSRLKEFKDEANFKSCLQQLTIDDVINAIKRSEKIEKDNRDNGVKIIRKNGFSYYEGNPSLSIHKLIKNILTQCRIL